MTSLKSNDNIYDSNILTGIAIVGIAIKLFFYQNTSQDGVDGPANSVIWGYGVVIIALIGILYITFALATKSNMQDSIIGFIKTIFGSSFPIIFLLGLLTWIITMNISYKSRINKGQVSKDYYTFNYVSSILIIIQIMIMLNYIRNSIYLSNAMKSDAVENVKNNIVTIFSEKTTQMATVGYAIGSVNYVIVGILQVILDYFSTDG
jgi:hypothetical protein